MATEPQFVTTPKTAWATLTAVNATASKNHDGTGTLNTDIFEIFEAGESGGYVETVKAAALGTNAASVLRIYLNNGSANTTAANNAIIAETALPGTTITETAALAGAEILLGISIPAGYKLLAGLGTAVAAGWKITAIGADY